MEKFVISIGACSLVMTAAAFVYLLLSKTLKNVQASKWRYYSWILILIGFVTPVKPCLGLPAVTIDKVTVVADETSEVAFCAKIGRSDFGSISEILLCVLFIVWLAGVALVLGAAFFKQRSFIRSVKRLSVPVTRDIMEKANMLAVDMCVFTDFKTVAVKEAASPMVAGLFKPLLILPDRSFSDDELHLILKHELVHLKHRDLFIKAFMILCGAVHWFNPFIRLFIRAAEQECELYCDETVMKNESSEAKKTYCQSILDTVSAERKASGRLVPALSSNFYFKKQGLEHRIKMILSFDKKHGLSAVCVLTAALVLFTGTAFAFSSDSRPSNNTDTFVDTTTMTYEISASEALNAASTSEAVTEFSPAVSYAYQTVVTSMDDGY